MMKPSGLDVWLDTGVHIEGYEVFDDEAKKEAKKKIIEMINKDECDFMWEQYYDCI